MRDLPITQSEPRDTATIHPGPVLRSGIMRRFETEQLHVSTPPLMTVSPYTGTGIYSDSVQIGMVGDTAVYYRGDFPGGGEVNPSDRRIAVDFEETPEQIVTRYGLDPSVMNMGGVARCLREKEAMREAR